MKNIFENKKGFSLIEMMVALGILSLIIIGLVTFFSGGTRAWVTGQYQLEAQRNARYAIDRMVIEIREGKNIISGSGGDTIVVSIPALGSELAYDVTYDLSGNTNTIFRIKNTSSNPLIDNVIKISGESIFKYYDSNGIEINPPDSTLSKVHINLKVDVDNDKNPDITLNTDINLRNYGLQE